MAPRQSGLDSAFDSDAGRVFLWMEENGYSKLPREQFGWLPSALSRAGVIPRNTAESHAFYSTLFRIAGREWERLKDRDAAIVDLVVWLGTPDEVRARHSGAREDLVDQATRDRFFAECVARGADFTSGFAKLVARDPDNERLPPRPLFGDVPASGEYRQPVPSAWWCAQVLFAQGVLRPGVLLDRSRLVQLGSCRRIEGGAEPDHDVERDDPRSPIFWAGIDPRALGDVVLDQIRGTDDDTAVSLVRGAARALRHADVSTQHWQLKGAVLRDLVGDIDRRMGEAPHKAPEALRRTSLEIWAQLCWGPRLLPESESPPAVVRLAAQFELARMRHVLERAHEPGAGQAFRAEFRDIMGGWITILCRSAPLWGAVRPLLLALRALSVSAVTPDLRYWPSRVFPPDAPPGSEEAFMRGGQHSYGEPNPLKPDPPEPWVQIPDEIAMTVHHQASGEEEHDQELKDLRTRFARFCLDRLASKGPGGPPLEADPHWRIGYIEAAAELRTNPRGKGHHILHYAARNDPHPGVRRAAAEAYERLRHGPTLGEMSPRTAFFRAFWALRRAHMRGLGGEVDDRGAQATRDQEVRRTTKRKDELLTWQEMHE